MRHSAQAYKAQYDIDQVPFTDAEEAWFWYVRCQRARLDNLRASNHSRYGERPCDPDDIHLAVMDLSRRGRIGPRHLAVLAVYGLMDRPPDSRKREEETDARFWDEALDYLLTLLRKKGIVA